MNLAAPQNAFGPAGLNWRRALGYGVLWGVAVTAWASFELPLADIGPAQWLRLEARLIPAYCVQGVALACATMMLEGHLTLPWVAATLAGFTLLGVAVEALVWTGADAGDFPAWGTEARHIYSNWLRLLFGGLFLAAYHLSAESERTRRLFAQAEIARQQTEASLGAARLQALQGHVDPALLLRVMVEVERRYARNAAGMAQLLDLLVGFLRTAMPGVRSGASTLAAEVLLALQYAKLRAELEPGRATLRIRVDGSMPDLPFPALLLLPVLDQLVADGCTSLGAELRVCHGGGQCTLSLSRGAREPGPWLSPDLMYRLQLGLRTVFGEAWALAVHQHPAGPALTLTLPLAQRPHPPGDGP